MKAFDVFKLWVVEKEGNKFICDVFDNEYKEVFTHEKIEGNVEPLFNSFSTLEIIKAYNQLDVNDSWILNEKDILLRYIKINRGLDNKNYNIDRILNEQKEYLDEFKKLQQKHPQIAKRLAFRSLCGAGILDVNGNLVGPYKEIFHDKQSNEYDKNFEINHRNMEAKKLRLRKKGNNERI